MSRFAATTVAPILFAAIFAHLRKIISVPKLHPILVLRKCIKLIISANADRRVVANLEISAWVNNTESFGGRAKIANF